MSVRIPEHAPFTLRARLLSALPESDYLWLPDGVIEVESGYAGGDAKTANYNDVCSGKTKHAEVVRITYDPAKIDLPVLLQVHFATHDPTQLNRQGNDFGPQYRSAIFASGEAQLRAAQAYIAELQRSERFKDRSIATEVAPAGPFYEAEESHQDYNAKHGRSCPTPPE